jgi:hypothetical protein
MLNGGWGNVVCMATLYGMGGRGIDSRWGRNFSCTSRPAAKPTQPSVQGGCSTYFKFLVLIICIIVRPCKYCVLSENLEYVLRG